MKKGKVVLFSFSAVIFVAVLLAGLSPENSGVGQVKKFSSYEELKHYIVTNTVPATGYQKGLPGMVRAPAAGLALNDSAMQAEEKAESNAAVDFSTTNIQIAGVDEADIVKSDGKYLYLVSGKKVTVIEAYPPEGAKVLSEIRLDGEPGELFINKNRLVVFERRWYPPELAIKLYDVADREKPVLKREALVNGSYVNSRMIGDYVYVIASAPVILPEPTGYSGEKIRLPQIVVNGRADTIPASEIFYFDYPDYSYQYTVILSLNIQDEGKEVATKTFLTGATQNIFVSQDNVYLTGWKMPEVWPLRDGSGRAVLPPPDRIQHVEKTMVHKLSIADGNIEYESWGEVPGRVLNQFSMDEHQGFFRIATTTDRSTAWEGITRHNNIYILDEKMNMAGRLEGLAPRERIYAVRFMGDRAYLVTFRQVDPLFVVDLKDPYNPKVLGELKIPGYSDYLHPYDENHLIGIGKEVAAVPEPLREPQGGFTPSVEIFVPPPVQAQGVKIALFDVSNPEKPKEIAKYVVDKEWSDSLALRDHKAFLFSRTKNLLVIPVSYTMLLAGPDGLRVAPYYRGWQGAYVFDISLDRGIVLKGRVEHREGGVLSGYEVKRSLYIDQVLYTVSDRMVKMNDLESLDAVNQIILQ